MPFLLPGLALASTSLPWWTPSRFSPFVPLLGWTLALQWYIDEYHSFSSWTHPSSPSSPVATAPGAQNQQDRDEIMGQWFQTWFYRGGLCAAVSTPLTVSSSLVILYRHFRGSEPASISSWTSPIVWTFAGLALSLFHIYFGNSQYEPFKRIGMPVNKGNNLRDLKGWVEMHKKRIWLVDIPAWLCFAWVAAQAV